MNLKKLGLKVLSVTLVVVMLLGVCAPAIAAAPEVEEKTEINYVSLGDSMSNGYGLEGYDKNSGVEDYGYGSYANLFANWLAEDGTTVNHAQLAMSGIRAEDLHWLLELDYNDAEAIALTEMEEWDAEAWNAKFSTGDYWTWFEICRHTRMKNSVDSIKEVVDESFWPDLYQPELGSGWWYGEYGEVALAAKYFQTKVAEGDVLSLGIGNGNFGVYMFGRMLEAIGFDGEPDDAMVYEIEAAIRELDPDMQKTVYDLIDRMYAALEENGFPVNDGDDTVTSKEEALINTVVYTAISYVLNYAGSVEAILQLNPDAEIILVALMNTFGDENLPTGTVEEILGELTLGNLLTVVFEPLNAYIAALPTYMQLTENSVYANATFYYAEADKVQCLVDVYGEDFYNENGTPNADSIIRDRFVESIVGNNGNGMIWSMLNNAGMNVASITYTDVVEYLAMTDAEKAVFAAQSEANAAKATSISMYLAFEDAIIACSGESVTLNSVLGLGALDANLFTSVMGDFSTNVGTVAANYTDAAIDGLATLLAAGINTQLEGTATITADEAKDLITAADTAAAVKAFMSSNPSMEPVLALYNTFGHSSADEVFTCTNADHASYCGQVSGIYSTLLQAVNGAKANIESLATLLAMPEALSASLQKSASVSQLLALFGRCVVGNGIGGHPSTEGHQALFEAVKTAYETKYTAQDETFKNALEALTALSELVAEYYDEAYAYGYAYADENGYIDAAEAAIDEAIAAIEALEIEDGLMSAELKAALEAELAEVVKTLNEVKAALTADKAATVEGLLEVISALEDDLYRHLDNIEVIFAQAGLDAYTFAVAEIKRQVEIIKTVVIPAILDAAETIAQKAYDYVVVKVGELMGLALDINAAVEQNLAAIRERIAEIYGIVLDVNATVEDIIAAIRKHIAKIAMGEYTVSDDSYYVAIDGDGYAALLADALNLTDDQFNTVAWDEVTFEELAKADFITVSYDDSSVLTFSSKQLLGYAKNYVDVTFRADANAYINDALSGILSESGFANVSGTVNAVIDTVVLELFADQEAVALDWAALVGEENLAYVDQARASIQAALVNAGVPATYEIEIDVVDALYANSDMLGITDALATINQAYLYEQLGANAIYTIEIPVLEMAAFSIESALYEKVRYDANYSNTLLAINKINPDATVAVLSNYDLFSGLDLELGKMDLEYTLSVSELLMLDEIPAVIEAIVAQIPSGDEIVLDLGVLADIDVYDIDIPVADLAGFAAEKFNALASFVETVEIPVTNETVALILDYAEKNFSVEAEYNAFVANVNAMLAQTAEIGVYTVEIPVGAIVDYAVDTYDYLVDLFALLAEVDYTVDDITVSATIDLDAAYDALSSIHPFAYAVLFENVFFVDISDVETNFEAALNAGIVDGDVLTFVLACLASDDITAPSMAGNEYIVEQILNALVVTCAHSYDNGCDADCNRCGELREVSDHVFTNYVSNNDATCTADGTKTAVCDVCNDATDTIVDEGSMLDHEAVGDWLYDDDNHWKVCSCGYVLDEAAHVDADSNDECDVCGKELPNDTPVGPGTDVPGTDVPGTDEPGTDEPGDAGTDGTTEPDTTTAEATTAVTTLGSDDDKGLSTGATVGIAVGATVVVAVGGFALAWFGFANKTWLDLLKLLKIKK